MLRMGSPIEKQIAILGLGIWSRPLFGQVSDEDLESLKSSLVFQLDPDHASGHYGRCFRNFSSLTICMCLRFK